MPVKVHFLVHRQLSSLSSFSRVLNPFTRAPFSRSKHFPEVSPPNTITPGIRFQYMKFWENKYSVYSKYCQLHCRLYSDFMFFHTSTLPSPSQSGTPCCIQLSFSLDTANLGQFLRISLSFRSSALLKSTVMLYHVVAWISLKLSHDLMEGMHFWQENHRSAVVSFSVHYYIRGQCCCFILHLDYLLEVCWSSFSTLKLLFVPVNKYLGGEI